MIVEKDVEAPEGLTVIKVENTRYALALTSAAYFGYPAEKLKVIGITGTKGKTTTTYMVKSILEEVGIKVTRLKDAQSRQQAIAEQYKALEEQLHALKSEMEQARQQMAQALQEKEQAQQQFNFAQTALDKVVAKKLQIIDHDSYKMFIDSLSTLTTKEQEIFDLYTQGLSTKDIIAQQQISENTLKYHNKNIYSKLGVKSRKELLQYIELMRNTR